MYASLSLNLLECRSAAKTILCLAGVFLSLVGDGYCQTKSVATSMRGFGVPFRVNANDESFLEVQLYVSRDLGKSWQFHSRQSTDLEEFPFFADQDGTYWFALKTLNRDRRLIPDGDIVKPELEIVVDTQKPELDFRIESDAAGRVACRWKATDKNIRPDSLEILYQPGLPGQVDEAAWQAVDVQLADAKIPATGIYADQVAWWPEPNIRQISVRLKISDSAGNSVYEDRNVIVPLVAWRSKSISTARPPGRETSDQQIPLRLNRLPKGKKFQAKSEPAGEHPPGVVCENGVCRRVKSPEAPNVPSVQIDRQTVNSNSAVASPPKPQSASELYGMAVPRLRPSNPVASATGSGSRHANPQTHPPASVASNQQQRVQARPTRTAQSSHPQVRTPGLPLIGSEAQPFAPPVPDGYVHVAAKPTAQQTSNGSGVTWESESYRWGPRNQSTFATTLKPDPSLVPSATSPRPRSVGLQVPANPSIHFQIDDQKVSQSSTQFPRNQYQGVVPTVPSNAIRNHLPQLMPGANSGQPVATNRQRLSKPSTIPPSSSANSNSLGPLQNYSDDRSSVYQPSAYAGPRGNARSLPPVVDPAGFDRRRSVDSNSGGNTALQMISTKRFRLDYAINAIDPSGVAKVDLWVTRDNGREWQLWGSDPDSVSPFPVQVNEEGRYGFRVVIHSKDGLTGQGPSRGDPPDMYIHVDSQSPLAKITSVPYGRGNEAGKLVINWSVSDPFISLRPIRLSYSRGATGPWTVIENGLRNVGRYVWKVEPNVPERIFLKIEATDQAGNVGVHQLSQSIDISGLVPRGTIRGVVPVGR